MVDLIITSGQHRNEMSAIVLAPLVTNSLKDLGYNVLLLFNPEKRTLLEIASDAYKSGRKIKMVEVEELLYAWEDKYIPEKYPGIPIFQFHNYGINPTDFDPTEEFYSDLESMDNVYDTMDFDDFKGDKLAYKLKYSTDGTGKFIIVEIPEITEIYRTLDEVRMLKKVFHHHTFKLFRSYFLSTDLERSRMEGLMGDRVIKILTHGLDYILNKEISSEIAIK